MKKILLILICVLLFVSCGKKNEETSTVGNNEITDEKIQELESLLKNETSEYLDIEDLQVDKEQKIITINANFDYAEKHDNNVFQAEQESVNFEMGIMSIAEVLAETDLFDKYIINTNEMNVVIEDRHKVKDKFGYSFDDTNLSEEIESYFMKKNKVF